ENCGETAPTFSRGPRAMPPARLPQTQATALSSASSSLSSRECVFEFGRFCQGVCSPGPWPTDHAGEPTAPEPCLPQLVRLACRPTSFAVQRVVHDHLPLPGTPADDDQVLGAILPNGRNDRLPAPQQRPDLGPVADSLHPAVQAQFAGPCHR